VATTRTALRTRSSTRSGSTSSTRKKTQAVADTTKSEAARVAGTASDKVTDVASTGIEQARQVTDQAMEQAHQLLDQATSQLHGQASEQTQRLSANLRQLGEHFSTMADSGQPGSTAHSLVQQLADRAHQAADYLERREPGDILNDVQDLGRRRPGAFLLGAALAGIAAGRLTTAVKDAKETGTAGRSTPLPSGATTTAASRRTTATGGASVDGAAVAVDPYPAPGGGW
jgi:DNA-binding protein H-NS